MRIIDLARKRRQNRTPVIPDLDNGALQINDKTLVINSDFALILSDAPFVPLYNNFTIKFGAVEFPPTTLSEIYDLPSEVLGYFNIGFDLNTGTTLTQFVACIPDNIYSDNSIIVQDISNNVKYLYNLDAVVSEFYNGENLIYNIYKLEIDNPYPVNSIHRFEL